VSTAVAGSRESGGYLSAPPEHERIAARAPAHEASRRGVMDEQGIDRPLRQTVGADPLAREDAKRFRGSEIEKRRVHEPIVDHHLRLAETLGGAQGEKPWIAGTGADQTDAARPHLVAPRRSSSRALASPRLP